jgi:hypothetical protein
LVDNRRRSSTVSMPVHGSSVTIRSSASKLLG